MEPRVQSLACYSGYPVGLLLVDTIQDLIRDASIKVFGRRLSLEMPASIKMSL